MQKIKFVAFFMIASSLVYGFSVNAKNDNEHPLLNAALNNINCRTIFTIHVINSMNTVFNSDSFSQAVSKLQSDVTELQTYLANNDTEGFRNYVIGTYDPDLKAARGVVLDWRKEYNKNLTITQKTSIKSTYTELKSTYDTCYLNTLKDYGSSRLNSFNNDLNAYQNRINNLASKGIDVTTLNQIIQDANTQIVQPLQDVLASANDSNSVKQTLQGYCLFDGCANGINFHLAAKFEIAKLDIALNTIKNNSNATQVSDKITQLEGYISAAKSALNDVDTDKYTGQQNTQVWNNIKSAYEIIKDISKALGGKT